jgi:hypothetical protein
MLQFCTSPPAGQCVHTIEARVFAQVRIALVGWG